MLQVVLGGFEVGLYAGDVRAQLVDVVDAGLGRELAVDVVLKIRELLRVVFLDLLGLGARPAEFGLVSFILSVTTLSSPCSCALVSSAFASRWPSTSSFCLILLICWFWVAMRLVKRFGAVRRRPAHSQSCERNRLPAQPLRPRSIAALPVFCDYITSAVRHSFSCPP